MIICCDGAAEKLVANGLEPGIIIGDLDSVEDHTLGNISLLADYSTRIDAVMLTDTGSIRVYDRGVIIDSHPGQQVSLFSIDPSLKVTSSGLKYPLDNLTLHSWWRGTLNEAIANTFSLDFNSGKVIVFLGYCQGVNGLDPY